MIFTIDKFTKDMYSGLKLDGWEKIPHDFKTDGASNAPDKIFGVDIFPAAVIHDYDYERIRRDVIDKLRELKKLKKKLKREADLRLKENMIKCAPKNPIVRAAAFAYWRVVRRCGKHALQSPGFQ
jgi:hypothetical protein